MTPCKQCEVAKTYHPDAKCVSCAIDAQVRRLAALDRAVALSKRLANPDYYLHAGWDDVVLRAFNTNISNN